MLTLENLIFSQDGLVFFGLIAVYFGIALFIYWLCAVSSLRHAIKGFSGVVAPFFVFASTIFALTVALLGNDVWLNHRINIDAVRQEGRMLINFSEIARNSPGIDSKKILLAEKQYVESAINVEWPLLVERKGSPQTQLAFSNLLKETLRVSVDKNVPGAIQFELIKSIDALTNARTNRLQVREGYPESTRWICVLLLGVMSLVGVASVHLDQPKALALSLAIATSVITIILILIALTVETHSGIVSVSDFPLRNAIKEIELAIAK
jgi:hypothetical protein